MGVDLLEFLDLLSGDKYRAVILHATPEKSGALKSYAEKLAEAKKGLVLDVLQAFKEDLTLSSWVDRFGPEQLKNLLVDRSKRTDLLVITRMDFILDSWRRDQRKDFYRLVEMQWNSYFENTRATLVFCLQTSLEIEDLDIKDSRSRSRVLSFEELNEIL